MKPVLQSPTRALYSKLDVVTASPGEMVLGFRKNN
jgi:hypothetical protein